MNNVEKCLLVGVSFSDKDKGVLVVGERKDGQNVILNSFGGKEAYDLYLKLITKKEKE
jgi:hypothetical protein